MVNNKALCYDRESLTEIDIDKKQHFPIHKEKVSQNAEIRQAVKNCLMICLL